MLVDCEQVFEDVGSGASWNRPGLNRLKVALQTGDCVKIAALDRLGRSLTEVLDLLGWLRNVASGRDQRLAKDFAMLTMAFPV